MKQISRALRFMTGENDVKVHFIIVLIFAAISVESLGCFMYSGYLH